MDNRGVTAWMASTALLVLAALTGWTAWMEHQVRRDQRARRAQREGLGLQGRQDPLARALPEHREAWVNRDRKGLPDHLASRVRRGPRRPA